MSARRDGPADRDMVAVWGAELDALEARYSACPDEESDAVGELVVAKEDQIAAAIPTSAAGAIVQIRLLRRLLECFDWGEWHDKMTDNLIAGLERIGGGDAT